MAGGGGGGQPTQTTSTSYQTNIPEYARPYVETMLGATQQQLFQGTPTGDGGYNITGFQPYKAYGGTYDAQGNQTSYDPGKSVAGFSPLQQQAQQGVAGLQMPGQYNTAMDVTGMGIMNAANLGAQSTPQNYQQQVAGYMNPYMQQVLQPQMDELRRQYGISGTQQAAQATQAGAFGGSRDAIMAAENQRNLGMAQNQAIGQAYGNAFNQAQNQYNQNAGFQLQTNQAAMQNAAQLAGLGQQQLTAQQGIYGLQNQMGAQQQALEQQKVNQAMQDYANAQQYPLMQLGTMSNMLRGLPMQAQTTNQYVAAPNPITQGIGAAGAAASLYNATKNAEGGMIKSMASGGIASVPRYDVGGRIRAQLENMDAKELQQIAETSESPEMQKMAREILSRSAPVQAASGGIMHFVKGDEVESDVEPLPKEGVMMAEAKIPEPKMGGQADIRGINAAPVLNNVGQTNAQKAFPLTSEGIMSNPAFGASPAAMGLANKAILEADKTEEQRKEDLRAKYGPNVALQNYRAEEMERKANLGDELARQKNMRLAEFFATWGSTPGPTLVAGMTALKAKIPSFIEDEKEARKLKREADKIIFELDQSARNEEIGLTDKAAAQKNEATKNAMEFQKVVEAAKEKQLAAASHVKGSELTSEATKFSATENRKGHEAVAASNREATAQRATEANSTKAYQQSLAAQEAVRRTVEGIEREKSAANSQYAADMKTISMYEGADLDAAAKKRLEAAQARVEAKNEEFQKRIDKAEKVAETSTNRYLEIKGEAPPASGGTNSTTTEERPSWVPKEAKKAQNGDWYIPNPDKPGKYLRVKPPNQ